MPRSLLALLATAAFAGCSPEEAGSLEVSGSLDFGEVRFGEQAGRSLRFVNSGRLPVRLRGFELELPEGLRAGNGGEVVEVPGLGETSVEVICAPLRGGVRTGILQLTEELADSRSLDIPFRCGGV
ncbi:MAG: hypothetical protein ACYC8T_18410, partial [Myxococcaceae bacterium]